MRPFQQLLAQARRDRPGWPEGAQLEELVWEELTGEAREFNSRFLQMVLYGRCELPNS